MNSEGMFAKKVNFSAGKTIMREGEKGGPFYILLKGKCEILKRDFPLTTISKKGIIFGEMGMILDIPRTATVKAFSDVEAYEVNITFDNMYAQYPKTTKSMMRTLAKRVVQQTDLIYGYIIDDEMVEFDELDKEE